MIHVNQILVDSTAILQQLIETGVTALVELECLVYLQTVAQNVLLIQTVQMIRPAKIRNVLTPAQGFVVLMLTVVLETMFRSVLVTETM